MSDDTPTVDPDDVPPNEQVRIITGVTRVMSAPEIVTGETSSTGKTISVEHRGSSYRLDAAKIFDGGTEIRDARYYELYTPERFRRRQRTNHAPGPQAGANQVSDPEDLPAPTHSLADDVADEAE